MMKLPPLARGFLRILVSLWRFLTWRRHLRKIPKFLIILVNRFVGAGISKDPQCTTRPSSPKYTVLRDGNSIPLDRFAASIYPFPGGNIRKTSRTSFDRSPERRPSWSSDVSRRSLSPGEQVQPRFTTEVVQEPDDDDQSASSLRIDYEASSITTLSERSAASNEGSEDAATDSEPHTATPTLPRESLRYTRRTKIKMQDTNIELQPLEFNFETFAVPSGWERHAHPEGCCYFYNPRKRVYTDNEIYDPEQLARIEERIRIFEATRPADFPPKAEIVFNIYSGNVEDIHYYCVDHDRRVIFFLTNFQSKWMPAWGEVVGAFSKNHLRYEIESEYWYFVQMYPHQLTISFSLITELTDTVLFLMGDIATSQNSNVPFTQGDLKTILEITSKARETIGSTNTVGTSVTLARFMFMICHSRFLNFHGESYGRIERTFSVYGQLLYPRTIFLQIISLFLFSAPDVHLQKLQSTQADKIVHMSAWQERMKKLLSEWQDLVTSSAILLNANVAFLAIQTVDQPPPNRSWAQIVSYVSVVANVGGMIVGLLLIRENRDIKDERDSVHVQQLFKGRTETLAILYSLPYALLMWGMISFLAAFGLMCLANAGDDIRAVVGFSLTLGGSLVFLCLVLGWHKSNDDADDTTHALTYYGPESEESDGNSTPSIPQPQPNSEAAILPVVTAPRTRSNGAAPSGEMPVLPPRVEGPAPKFVGPRILIGRALLWAYHYVHPVVMESRRRQTAFNFV